MRTRHIAVSGSQVVFNFRGKSGKDHFVSVIDRRMAAIVRRCQRLPGQPLFQYVEDGRPVSINSDDVNEYLREILGNDFTGKDVRTCTGTYGAAYLIRSVLHGQKETDRPTSNP